MWREVKPTHRGIPLPPGIVTVYNKCDRVTFGKAAADRWRLCRFKTVKPFIDDESGLAGFQFLRNGDGSACAHKTEDGALVIYCKGLLREAGAAPGRYRAHRERDGFVVVDFRGTKVEVKRFALKKTG